MSGHEKDIADTVQLVLSIGGTLREKLCDHQGYFLIVLDDHSGAMPATEDFMRRDSGERQRFADVLRMWAGRIESGRLPTRGDS